MCPCKNWQYTVEYHRRTQPVFSIRKVHQSSALRKCTLIFHNILHYNISRFIHTISTKYQSLSDRRGGEIKKKSRATYRLLPLDRLYAVSLLSSSTLSRPFKSRNWWAQTPITVTDHHHNHRRQLNQSCNWPSQHLRPVIPSSPRAKNTVRQSRQKPLMNSTIRQNELLMYTYVLYNVQLY